MALVVFLVGYTSLLLFIYHFSSSLSEKSFWKGFLLILIFSFLTRYVMLEVGWPNDLMDHPLFDSREFASSLMNASFADLFVNLFILLSISIFIFERWIRSAHYRSLASVKGTKRYLFTIFYLGSFLLLFHWIFLQFQTIYHNSQVTFDINNFIEFDTIRIGAFLAYLIFALCIVLMSHVAFRCARQLTRSKTELLLFYSLTLGLFVLVNSL